jgi:hypothetical protein
VSTAGPYLISFCVIAGPYLLSFCIAAVVCLLDISLVTGDRMKCPVHPLYCAESRRFVFVNGLIAVVGLFLAMHGGDILTEYHIPVGLMWSSESPWSRAAIVGFLSIVFVRSKLLSFKENGVIGFDLVYIRFRNSCISALMTATFVKRTAIRNRFKDKFLDDQSFTHDFGEIVLNILKHNGAKPVDIRMVQNAMETPETDAKGLAKIHETLIRSALVYGGRRSIRHTLRYWRRPEPPDMPLSGPPRRRRSEPRISG